MYVCMYVSLLSDKLKGTLDKALAEWAKAGKEDSTASTMVVYTALDMIPLSLSPPGGGVRKWG